MVTDGRVAEILAVGAEAAASQGRSGVRLGDLSEAEVSDLVEATLDFLRARPGKASHIPEWTTITAMQAGVMPWWAGLAGEEYHGPEVRRLRSLRRDVYDYLGDALGLISKEPGQGSSIHVSPPGADEVTLGVVPGTDLVTVSADGVGFGTPEQNKRVELAAMAKVCEHFEGWEAEDVSLAKCGWDITFTRSGDIRHVEVKGRSGKHPTVLLTANEVNTAQSDPLWELVIVTQALIDPQVKVVTREDVTAALEPYVYRFAAGS
ncbi:MAG: DUF3883 domain-containing protein [Nocardioidaceae bacterium]|nr:DUF3883 domain-containing protein [Nocardioidaceae bacterium]